jgi:hypothetical protein
MFLSLLVVVVITGDPSEVFEIPNGFDHFPILNLTRRA